MRPWIRTIVDRVPLTPRGLLLATASGAALGWWGLESLDLLLLVIGASGLVVLVLTTILVVVATLWARGHVGEAAPHPEVLEAGSRLRTGFTVPSLDRVPLLRIDWAWTAPAHVDCLPRWHEGVWEEEVVAHRRTAGHRLTRRFEVSDVLGLVRVAWNRTAASGPRILPAVGRLRRAPVVQAFAAAEGVSHPLGQPEGDRMEIRRYVPGDSARDIHWKAFARNRQLNVRLRERSIERSRRTVAYLVHGPGDEPAAAAARVALESEAFGSGWRFGADGTDELTDELPAALLALAASGDVPAEQPSGLPAMLDRLAGEGRLSCVVFAPALLGPWIAAALAAGLSFPGSITFVVATDGLLDEPDESRWHRWVWRPVERTGTVPDDLREVLGLLGAVGPVLVVDRPTGRSWSPGPSRGREIVA